MQESFAENINRLIELFSKIKERADKGMIEGLDPAFIQNLDLLVRNYQMMRNQLPDEVINQMGEPIKEMIAQMIDKLNVEFAEDHSFTITEEIKKAEDPSVEKLSTEDQIKQIDARLSKPGLTSKELDELLDKRAGLQRESH